MFRRPCSVLLLLVLPGLILNAPSPTAYAADVDVTHSTDAESGFAVWTLKSGQTELKVVPAAGANAYSLKFDGRELLKTPKSLKELPGFVNGNPLLYPTPNRVRNAEFTFEGQQFKFPANNKGNFLHGLVHNVKWEQMQASKSEGAAELNCELAFRPGSEQYRLFPYGHNLRMTYKVSNGRVEMTYTVDNFGDKPLPFGFAFHPWFLYLGDRANTYLTIPATHHMESPQQLPTGRLEELSGSPFDVRSTSRWDASPKRHPRQAPPWRDASAREPIAATSPPASRRS